MDYSFTDLSTVKKLLWFDFIAGFITGVFGIIFLDFFSSFFGLSTGLLLFIFPVHFIYSVYAFFVASRKETSVCQYRFLIAANYFWAVISVGLLIYFFSEAALFGKLFLFLQIVVVGGLAWIESLYLTKTPQKNS